MLGQIHLFGDEPDYQEALIWLTKAAKQGNAVACKQLGRAFSLGLGTPRNLSRAVHWYQRGAKAGSPDSLFSLYLLHKENEALAKAGAALSLALKQKNNQRWKAILDKLTNNLSISEMADMETEVSHLKDALEELPNFTKEKPLLKQSRIERLTFPNGLNTRGKPKMVWPTVLVESRNKMGHPISAVLKMDSPMGTDKPLIKRDYLPLKELGLEETSGSQNQISDFPETISFYSWTSP